MKSIHEFIIKSPEAMREFAASMAKLAQVGDVITLSGELGSGKTTFAQGFIAALLKHKEAAASPSFTLLNIYETNYSWRLYHSDLYRLRSPDELIELGLADGFDDNVTLIEWPEIAADILPQQVTEINFEYISENCRKVSCKSAAFHYENIWKNYGK